MRRLAQTVLPFAVLLSLLAPRTAHAQGTAELTLDGPETSRTAVLDAHFATGVDSLRGGENTFALYFYDEAYGESQKWAWIARTGGSPSPGTYTFSTLTRGGPLADSTFTLGGELNASERGRPVMLVSTQGGTLTIDTATEDRIEGSFQVDNLMGGTITGTFNAPRGTFRGTRGPGG